MTDEIRPEAKFYSEVQGGRTSIHPEHWPAGVNMISLEGLGLIGLDQNGNMYLDGDRLYTEKRLNWFERLLASLVAGASVVAAIAGIFSAIATWHEAFEIPTNTATTAPKFEVETIRTQTPSAPSSRQKNP